MKTASLNSTDEGHVSSVVLLDLTKAFHTVNHSLLLSKLTEYGVSEASLKWFQSYLTQCSQQTCVGGTLSSKRHASIGVPLWSPLGPLHFLVLINDLPHSVTHSSVILFADDTAIYYSGKSCIEIKNKINEDLGLFKRWLIDHCLMLTIAKSKVVLVGGKQQLKNFQDLNLKVD